MENTNTSGPDRPTFLEGSLEPTRNGSPIDNLGPDQDFEDFDYQPVPPRRSVAILVRYHVRGRGQPLPYPLDEEPRA